MESWVIEKYRSPALMKGIITRSADSQSVAFDIGNEKIIDLHISGMPVEQLEYVLLDLQNPASSIWSTIKDKCAIPWVSSLLNQLDALSLIEETFVYQRATGDLLDQVGFLIDQSVSLLVNRISTRIALYRPYFNTVEKLLSEAKSTPRRMVSFQWLSDFEGNFALQSIALQINFVSINFPEMLSIWCRIFRLVANKLDIFDSSENDQPEFSLCQFNMTDLQNIEAYALSFSHLLTLVPLRAGNRMTTFSLSPAKPCNGLALAASVERISETALSQLGTSGYTAALAGKICEITPFVQGIYVEQFHVTSRFVEIITPLLSRRFKSSIRSRLFTYFQEEFGHEKYELETCVALGLECSEVESSIPLPLTTLYIDAYWILAHECPLSFMLALMVTEGMLEQESPLHEKLNAIIEQATDAKCVASMHNSLNEELNHSSLTRLFLAEIHYLSPQQQIDMLRAFLFILELNFRALEEAAIFYGDQDQFRFCSLKSWERPDAK